MAEQTIKQIYEKWKKYVDPKEWDDIKTQYDAIQTAILLENTYEKNKEMMLKEEADPSIAGMQASVILPVIRRMYPKIMMKEFVSVQSLTSPQAVVHYLKRIYKTNKNGLTIGQEFKGFSPVFGKNFEPFFSADMISAASLTANGKKITLGKGTINYTKEDGSSGTYVVDATTSSRAIVALTFLHSTGGNNDAAVSGWFIYGKTIVNNAINYGWKFIPKSVCGSNTSAIENIKNAIANASQSDITITLSASSELEITVSDSLTAITAIGAGWFEGDTPSQINNTAIGWYAIDPTKYPHITNEMSVEIQTMPITLKNRNFKVRYTPLQEKIYSDYLKLDLSTELVNEISDQMAFEIDREIKLFLEMNVILELTEFVDLTDFRTRYQYTPFASQMEYIFYRMNLLGAKMERFNKLGKPNVALISPNIEAQLYHLKTFKFFDDNVSNPAGGIYKVGSIPGKIDFYVDPTMETDEILLAYKHNGSPFGAGAVYAPYFNYLSPEIYDGNTSTKTRVLTTSYGLEMVPFGEYLYGLLKITGLEGVN